MRGEFDSGVPHRNLDILEHYATHMSVGDAHPLSAEAVMDVVADPDAMKRVLVHAYLAGGENCDTSRRDWVVCDYPEDKCPAWGPQTLW